jgi:hypothetical protein
MRPAVKNFFLLLNAVLFFCAQPISAIKRKIGAEGQSIVAQEQRLPGKVPPTGPQRDKTSRSPGTPVPRQIRHPQQ